MSRSGRRTADAVEFIDSDPRAFGSPAPAPASPTGTSRARWVVLATMAVVAVVAAGVIGVRSSGSRSSVPPTSSTTPTVSDLVVTTSPVAQPAGSVAPIAVGGLAFSLSVQPSVVLPDGTVTMQLTGDLTAVADRVAAVAWLDRVVDGKWRTAYWLARSSDTAQQVRGASGDRAEAGPDAVTVAADAPVSFRADVAAGTYRMCRYVPLRRDPATDTPNPPAYVCASLVVG